MMVQMCAGGLWVPPGSDRLIVPPSPPREQREKIDRIIKRDIQPIRCPGIAPVAWREYQELMPTAIINHRRAMRPAGVSTLLTSLKWSYSFETTGWLDNLGTNPLTSTGSPTNPTGKIGKCIAGTGGAGGPYASCAYNAAFNFSASNYTWSGWFLINATTTFQGIFAVSARDYGLLLDGASNWRMLFSVASTSSVSNVGSSLSAPSTGTWYFILGEETIVAGVSTTWTFYVNGTQAGTSTVNSATTGIMNQAGSGMHVLWDNNNNKVNGQADELNGWLRAPLTAGEKTQLAVGDVHSAYPFN